MLFVLFFGVAIIPYQSHVALRISILWHAQALLAMPHDSDQNTIDDLETSNKAWSNPWFAEFKSNLLLR